MDAHTGIKVDSDGVSVDYDATKGLKKGSGSAGTEKLEVNINTATGLKFNPNGGAGPDGALEINEGPGLRVASGVLRVNTAAGTNDQRGLQFNGDVLGLEINTSEQGLKVDKDGLALKLASNKGLRTTGSGSSDGLAVDLSIDPGLEIHTDASSPRVPANDGLRVKAYNAGGIEVTGDGVGIKLKKGSVSGRAPYHPYGGVKFSGSGANQGVEIDLKSGSSVFPGLE